MVPYRPSRRRVLAGAGALLAALSGCEGATTDTTRRPDVAPGRRSDPPHQMVRVPDGGPVVVEEREEPGGTTTRVERAHGFVASAADREALAFADVDGAAGVREFLAATDFESETVYYQQEAIAECHRRELCYVAWTARSVETRYADVLRPATVACEVDANDRLGTFIRIPEPLDPDRINRYSSGHSYGRGGCDRLPEERRGVGGRGADAATGDAAGGDE